MHRPSAQPGDQSSKIENGQPLQNGKIFAREQTSNNNKQGRKEAVSMTPYPLLFNVVKVVSEMAEQGDVHWHGVQSCK